MALRSKTNPYPGINIHLNSYLQSDQGDWVSYHSSHIIHLRDYLDQQLPEHYYAVSEHGLQIGGFDAGTGIESRSRIRPDITIARETGEPRQSPSAGAQTSSPTGTLTLIDTLQDSEELIGLMIYHTSQNEDKSRPVARIELLSPANKRGGAYHNEYSKKRRETLEAGLQLIEIDYLHSSHPVIRNLPSYTNEENGAYPYIVLINDPRPTIEEAQIEYFAWHVNDPLPVIPIKLLGNDNVIIDLGHVYNRTYELIRFYHQNIIDYAEQPLNFDTYTETDQQKIMAMLSGIREQLGRE